MGKKRIRKNRLKDGRKRRAGNPRSGVVHFRAFFATAGVVGLSLLFILGYDILTQGRMFAARQIVVTGNQRLSKSRVLALAGIKPGANIFAVNLSLARRRLLTDGWIAAARVGRVIPDQLVIQIREHVPIAVIDLGKTYVLGLDGTIIARGKRADYPGLPMVTGLSYADLPLGSGAPDRSFSSLLALLRFARTRTGPLGFARLKWIEVDPDLGLTLHADGRVKTIRIGEGRFAQKYARVARLLRYLGPGPDTQPIKIVEIDSDSRVVAGPFLDTGSEQTGRRS